MQYRIMHRGALLWLTVLNLISPSVAAQSVAAESAVITTTPGKAFWEWFDEYADDNGSVMDPMTYAQTRRIGQDHTLLRGDKISKPKVVIQEPVTGEDEL